MGLFGCRVQFLPVIELEARSPVGGSEQSLNSTGQVDKQIAHEEKSEQKRGRTAIKCAKSSEKMEQSERDG